MTIKQQGGIFGRNPTFNDVDVDGTLNVGGSAIPAPANIAKLDTANTFTADQDISGSLDVTKAGGSAIVASFAATGSNAYISLEDQNTTNFLGFSATTDVLKFWTQNNSRFEIDGSGNATVKAGNLVIGTSGKGIDFSATSGTGTSELFDDYEEGTWTPTGISAGTVDTAKYTKIGDVVTITLLVSGAITLTSGTIGGLPYTALTTSGPWYFADFAVGSGEIPMPTIAGTSIYLRTANQSTGAVSVLGDLTGTYISITATYHV